MNWATIAPETRLYKGKNLYRWEDSPGLGLYKQTQIYTPTDRIQSTIVASAQPLFIVC